MNALNGTPYQVFRTKTGLTLGSNNRVSLFASDGETIKLGLAREFTPVSLSSSGKFDLPLAFVGYGIQSTNDNYDDFKDIDVTGKAVILLRHEPIQGTTSTRFNGTKNSAHAYLTKKVQMATSQGAAAVILCTDQVTIDKRGTRKSNSRTNEDYELDSLLNFKVDSKNFSRSIPVFHCQRKVIDRLLESSGKPSLADLELEIDESVQHESFELPDCRIQGEFNILQWRIQF